jgi:hypothetical protein
MTIEHALLCKMGGLVHIRHDDVADEWRHLWGTALSRGPVKHEPRIFSSVSRWVQVAAGNTTTPPSLTPTTDTQRQSAATEELGNTSCHRFWECSCTTIFNMTIMDTDVRSYQKEECVKVLKQHEKEKKDKYLQNCLEMRNNGLLCGQHCGM